MSDFAGMHGLIVGVANKRSIAWAIAKAVAGRGARLAVTYQGERLEENVRELSADLADPLILPLDVTSDEQIADVAAKCDETFGGLDFVVHGAAFAPREEIDAAVSRDLARRLPCRARRQRLLAGGAGPRDRAADGEEGRRQPADAHLSGQRRACFPNYNVMGVAKAALESSVRYLAAELGPKAIRVNAISAGPIKTLAASGIGGFSSILQVYRDKAPLRRNTETAEVADAAAFLLGPAGRGVTGEILARRRRLQHRRTVNCRLQIDDYVGATLRFVLKFASIAVLRPSHR